MVSIVYPLNRLAQPPAPERRWPSGQRAFGPDVAGTGARLPPGSGCGAVGVCRKCYVHPAVFEGYLDGTLVTSLNGAAAGRLQSAAAELRPDEAKVLTYLRHRAAGQRQGGLARATTTAKKAA